MQGFLACGFIASARRITKCVSLYFFLLAVIISSLTDLSMYAQGYFQAGGKQSKPFYHLP
jgi:hypothetical protein